MRIKRDLIILLFLSSLANATDYYKCFYLRSYKLQDSGLLKETHNWGENGFSAFTVDSRTGEYRSSLETLSLKVVQVGNSDKSFLAINPESVARYGWQLKITEYVDSPKKPFIKADIFPLGDITTGYCTKF